VSRQSGRQSVPPALGVDVGGVLVHRATDDTDTSFFGDRPMDTPAVPGAVEALAALANGPFESRIYLVSKAGPKISSLTRQWLEHTGFYDATGLNPEQVHFCRRREDKEPICRRLGITHFVDDRMSVLNHLGCVPHRYLFTGGVGERPLAENKSVPAEVTVVGDWQTLRERLVESVRS
jgi:hypothetical protein